MYVRFTNPDEFIAELRLAVQAHQVEQLRLRVTNHFKQVPNLPYQQQLVVAGFIETQWGGSPQQAHFRRLTQLRHYCGDRWWQANSEDEKTIARAQQLVERLAEVAFELGLEVRHGIFVDEKEE